MTARKTDRYVRTGGPVPQIYFGTLAGLTQAMKDAHDISKFLPELVFTIWMIQGKQRKRVKTYQAGQEIAA
jgi:hypothetical protein